jgi:methylase of polypeptide subunit release factors
MLTQLAKEKLRSEGQVFLELNAAYASDIAELFVRENFQVALKEDMQGKKRMLRAWR